MIKKVRLTSILDKTTDKVGQPLKTKDGKPYTRRLIKCEEYGDQLISGFNAPWNQNWKEGDEVTLEITEVKKDNKTFLNFGRVDMLQRVMEMVTDLQNRISRLEEIKEKGYEYPKNEVDEIPFDDEPPLESLEDPTLQ